HRDMKPSNCFVITKDGEPDFVKLVDFGISKVRSTDDGQAPQLTRTNSALGTPLYMSPEQARSPRDVDHRTDLYSVGAILYEMLSGRTPYTAESGEYTEILFKIFTTEPDPIRQLRPELPDALGAVIHRSLMRDRDARYASAADMAEALAPFADNRSSLILSRFHGTRGRSLLPGSAGLSQSVPAPSPQPGAVRAQTYPSGNDVGRAAIVPTDVGVTREAGAGAGTKRGHVGLIAGVGVAVLVAAGAGVFVTRTHAHPPAPDILRPPPPPPTVVAGPQESAVLQPIATTPPPSASVAGPPSASAAVIAPKPTVTHGVGPNPPLPTKLGDLKIQ
ncbi:MAG TPA: serine/threonine-protein kinase, partial [Polyangiaceae bacterium]|nr:serine/threonine-protein kinase [Polyangiaceae bacterium]